MKGPSISVIIPMYNVERFIGATLKSILRQNRDDIEIIVVNDGSKDGSRAVAEGILKNSNVRWTIIDQPNGGVSVARNTGLQHANGRFIKFVDGDDLLFDGALDILEREMVRTGADVVFGNYVLRTLKGKTIFEQPHMGKLKEGYQDRFSFIIDFLKFKPFVHLGCMLIRRDVIESSSLRFTRGIKIAEDVEFAAKLFYHSNSIYYVDKFVYDWIRRPQSATKARSSVMFQHVAVMRRLINYFRSLGEFELASVIEEEILPIAFAQVVGILAYNRLDYQTWVRLVEHPVIKGYLSKLSVKYLDLSKSHFHRQMIVAREVLRLSPTLLYLLLRGVRKYHEIFGG
ncbi:glycosyltransferase family 2 protein [Fervidobacterium thailandense]|uniref:Glycosyltransferase 2-like domain-containing protein n=1 Tax=Fervidobacterium thailandense TaxID=1008305 RepID=A0A1E3G2J0_9BACT|nr:glycosyltransferase family 2 protein [Fervidobacterium thailandense]ODN30447.1 hypothetical protein A4H02_05280 [Fervidobacterium thailandense]